jgi:hypothetical protein
LETARLVRQTPASAELHLYGDPTDPGYRDEAPRDGVDDRRHAVLHRMAMRFAPFMVLNTTNVPLDFKFFARGRSVFPLHIDTWNTVAESGVLVKEKTINMLVVAREPRTPLERLAGSARCDDCRLLELLDYYHPDAPTSAVERTGALQTSEDLFQVLFFDFPGYDEKSWRVEYEDKATGQLPEKYRQALLVYVHPFLQHVWTATGEQGYELLLQYWFFYPNNDGGNNHKGDWEHVNVAVAPLGTVERLTGGLMPYVKGGYGLSWYRLENVRVNGDTLVAVDTTTGEPVPVPDGPWVRQPKLSNIGSWLLPNTWHLGAGLELLAISSYTAPPKGVDFALRVEWTMYYNRIGVDLGQVDIELLALLAGTVNDLPSNRWVPRHEFKLGATLSF